MPLCVLVAAALGVPSPAGAGTGPTAPTFVRTASVNDPSTDVDRSDAEQVSPAIAVLPNTPVVAWLDTGSPSPSFTGYGRSTNNGSTFTDLGAPSSGSAGDSGDPALAAHQASGRVYLAVPGRTADDIRVLRSTNAGQTFTTPVSATPGVSTSAADPSLAVDNASGTGNGNVYLCASLFSRVIFTRSTDQGATFSPNGGSSIATPASDCNVVTGPDHAVYVLYVRDSGTGPDVFVRRSGDRGQTFAAPVRVASLQLTSLDLLTTPVDPVAAVNPVTGTIYVTYTDDPSGADQADVFGVSSSNGGATWSAPTQINTDDGDRVQEHATVAVTPDGSRIMFSYDSRSFDPRDEVFVRRGRIGVVSTTTGAVTLRSSFQLGPSSPAHVPLVDGTRRSQIVSDAAGRFHDVWVDDQTPGPDQRNQPDVRYARVDSDSSTVGLAITMTRTPASPSLGQTVTYTAKVTNSGPNEADDVFLDDTFRAGLAPTGASGGTCHTEGRFVACGLGSIAAGATKTVTLTAVPTTTGDLDNSAAVTTSDNDTSGANSATATVTAGGTLSTTSLSTGDIAGQVADTTFIQFPVPDEGTVLDAVVRIRMDQAFPGDMVVTLISPAGTEVPLAVRPAAFQSNFGTGANSCSGNLVELRDDAAQAVAAEDEQLVGPYRPQTALIDVAGEASEGTWFVRVTNEVELSAGTLGCVQLDIVHPK